MKLIYLVVPVMIIIIGIYLYLSKIEKRKVKKAKKLT